MGGGGSEVNMQKYEAPATGMINFGQERMDASDFIPPRVKVLQAMSQETVNDEGVVGDFFNTLTRENYGKALRFIPLSTFKNRLLIVRPERRDEINKVLAPVTGKKTTVEGDGLQCRSLDTIVGVGSPGMECAECPLSQWVGKFPPLCSESYNVTAMNELGDLIILSFSKSAAKTGKKLISMMRMRREKPWTSIFEATTHKESNDKGTFAVPEIRVTGERTDDTLLRVAAEWMTELSGRVIDLSSEEYAEEPVGAPEEGEAPF